MAGRLTSILLVMLVLSGCASMRESSPANPEQARAMSDRALAQLDQGDVKGAIAALNKVIAFGSPVDSDYTRRAAAYGALGQYAKALADTDRALLLAPDQWRTHFERALLNQKLGRIDDAINDLDSAINLNGGDQSLLRRRGYLTVVAGRFDEAVTVYDRLSRLDADSLTAATGRGVAFYLAGEWRAAARAFDQLLAQMPGDAITALWFTKSSMRAYLPVQADELGAKHGPEPEWRLIDALAGDDGIDEVARIVGGLKPSPEGGPGLTACERALFLGEWRVIRLGGRGARRDFETAQQACPADSIERAQAHAELARLAAATP